jgi:hypothetical protein
VKIARQWAQLNQVSSSIRLLFLPESYDGLLPSVLNMHPHPVKQKKTLALTKKMKFSLSYLKNILTNFKGKS